MAPEATENDSKDPSVGAVVPNPRDPLEFQGEIDKIINEFFGEDYNQQLQACRKFKKVIYRAYQEDKKSQIEKIVADSRIVSRWVEFLVKDEFPDLQYETCILISHLAYGTTNQGGVVEAGVVDPLMNLLRSPHHKIVNEAVFALSNIAGEDGPQIALLISKGIVNIIINIAESQTTIFYLITTARMIINILRGSDILVTTLSNKWAHTFIRMIKIGSESVDLLGMELLEMSYFALNTLISLAPGDESWISEIGDSGIIPLIVQTLLSHHEHTVVPRCLSVIAHLVSSDVVKYTDEVLNAGILPTLAKLSTNPQHEKSATWIFSRIAAKTKAHCTILMDAGIFPKMLEILGSTRDSRREAVFTISNIMRNGTIDHIRFLLKNGAISHLIRLLESNNPEIIEGVLHAILWGFENLLNIEEGFEDDNDEDDNGEDIEDDNGEDIEENVDENFEEDVDENFEEDIEEIDEEIEAENEEDIVDDIEDDIEEEIDEEIEEEIEEENEEDIVDDIEDDIEEDIVGDIEEEVDEVRTLMENLIHESEGLFKIAQFQFHPNAGIAATCVSILSMTLDNFN